MPSTTYGRAHPIHSLVTIGPPSSSTLSEEGPGEATRALARDGLAPRGYLVPIRASSLVKQTDFRLRMGATLEKRSDSVYNLTYVLGATLFLREGGFQAMRKTQLAHSSSYLCPHTHAGDRPQVGATPTSSYAHAHARPISKSGPAVPATPALVLY